MPGGEAEPFATAVNKCDVRTSGGDSDPPQACSSYAPWVTLWPSCQSPDGFIADCPGVEAWHSSPASRGCRWQRGAPDGWGRGAALPEREGLLPQAQHPSCCSSLCGRDPQSGWPPRSSLPSPACPPLAAHPPHPCSALRPPGAGGSPLGSRDLRPCSLIPCSPRAW